MLRSGSHIDDLASVRDELRARGLRWTPQRRTVVEVLGQTRGHVTGAALVERCRERDAATIPSTVYRTLDVLEQIGLVRHGHGPDGREEYHVGAEPEHGHLHCSACGASWEVGTDAAIAVRAAFEASHGFEVDLSHLSVLGRCRACREAAST
ncbi:MAG: Fur family transcriptional regulator [Chloroflexota bacterium]